MLEISFSSGRRAADAEEEKRWEIGVLVGFLRRLYGILESRHMDVWEKVWDSGTGTSGEKRSELSQLLWVGFIERRNISIDSVKRAADVRILTSRKREEKKSVPSREEKAALERFSFEGFGSKFLAAKPCATYLFIYFNKRGTHIVLVWI